MTGRDQIIEAIPAALRFANDYGPLPGANAGDLDAQVEIARRFVSAAEAAGMRMVGPGEAVVPRVPTVAMENAAVDATGFDWTAPRETGWRRSPQVLFAAGYSAMLAAAEAGDE